MRSIDRDLPSLWEGRIVPHLFYWKVLLFFSAQKAIRLPSLGQRPGLLSRTKKLGETPSLGMI